MLSAIALALAVATPAAAAPPVIVSSSVEGVTATAATLRGSIDPGGTPTTYRFEYLTETAYLANLAAAREPFEGATPAPPTGIGKVGAGNQPINVSQRLTGLAPLTAYHYRLRTAHGEESAYGPTRPFATQEATSAFALLDGRAWELVSPIAKNGGTIGPPGSVAGGGVFQAARSGGAFTYSSADSFDAAAAGAPAGSQYLSSRGSSGWTYVDITTPLLAGSYGDQPNGVPYQLFSADLDRGLLSDGERCRGDSEGECPVVNPALPGSGAPAGYRNYYLRDGGGGFQSLLTPGDLGHTSLPANRFQVRLVGETPDIAHVILSSCAALAAGAVESPGVGGCDEAAQNLYEWSGGELTATNVAPGETQSLPGAEIAAPMGAISLDGRRVYWERGTALYLRDGSLTRLVDPDASFQTASADGGTAYFLKDEHLYRYLSGSGSATDITPGGEVEGVLGTSSDASHVYYVTPGGLYLWNSGQLTRVADAAASSDYLPGTGDPVGAGTARVTEDGSHLLFLSAAELTGYPSEGQAEVFLYGPQAGVAPTLVCVSCNPTGERPLGPATIPGALANGVGPDATAVYEPRSLGADGGRAFFDSPDSLVPQDSNGQVDVYEWEAAGVGTCALARGCVQLISGGRDPQPSHFLDADADGRDAFFITSASLYPLDPGSADVYDARIEGGFPIAQSQTPCVADACQSLPQTPEDPTPGTLVPNSGNPPLTVAGESQKKKKKHRKGKKKKVKKRGKSSKKSRHGRKQ